jgi:hypothetical protein
VINPHLNQSIKSILILSAFVLVLSLAVYLTGTETAGSVSSKQCQLTETLICQFNLTDLNDQQVVVNFNEKVQIEEQNTVQLTLPEQFSLKQAWVQGVNMYMGKIAVVEQTELSHLTKNAHELWFFIGSCSEPQMRWQLIIELENRVSLKTERFFVNFSTTLP